jgi:hypothetical protein
MLLFILLPKEKTYKTERICPFNVVGGLSQPCPLLCAALKNKSACSRTVPFFLSRHSRNLCALKNNMKGAKGFGRRRFSQKSLLECARRCRKLLCALTGRIKYIYNVVYKGYLLHRPPVLVLCASDDAFCLRAFELWLRAERKQCARRSSALSTRTNTIVREPN